MFKSMILALTISQFGVTPMYIRDRVIGSGFIWQKHYLDLIYKQNYTKDDILYNPNTGELVIGLTNNPQRSGRNGEFIQPGDCWEVINTNVKNAQLIVDRNVVTLYRAYNTDNNPEQPAGFAREITITIDLLPGCDTTTAF